MIHFTEEETEAQGKEGLESFLCKTFRPVSPEIQARKSSHTLCRGCPSYLILNSPRNLTLFPILQVLIPPASTLPFACHPSQEAGLVALPLLPKSNQSPKPSLALETPPN